MKQYFIVLSRERLATPSRLLALLLAMGLSLLLLSCSGKSNSGKSSSSAGIPTEYCDELVKLAEDGNAEAQYNLALLYYMGEELTQSYPEAYKWLLKSAEQGNAKAQYSLGTLYLQGQGVTQSYTEAIKWYRKSAEQGNSDAQFVLGGLYFQGQGISQSYTEAFKWYQKSAEQGDPRAEYFLSLCYWDGIGVAQSRSEGLDWLVKSAGQGFPNALYKYGEILYDSRQYDTAMVMYALAAAKGFEKAVKMFNDWVVPMAKQGIAEAQYSMGLYYQQKDKIDDAIPWFTLSAEQGYQDAIKALEEIKEADNKK